MALECSCSFRLPLSTTNNTSATRHHRSTLTTTKRRGRGHQHETHRATTKPLTATASHTAKLLSKDVGPLHSDNPQVPPPPPPTRCTFSLAAFAIALAVPHRRLSALRTMYIHMYVHVLFVLHCCSRRGPCWWEAWLLAPCGRRACCS